MEIKKTMVKCLMWGAGFVEFLRSPQTSGLKVLRDWSREDEYERKVSEGRKRLESEVKVVSEIWIGELRIVRWSDGLEMREVRL
jgi:hypothetical protein